MQIAAGGVTHPHADGETNDVVFELSATNEGVRACVANVSSLMRDYGASEEDIASIELTLAEVLNNVVEHAYADTTDGEIQLRIDNKAPNFLFVVLDSGRPLPNGRLPMGTTADPALEDYEQEEGGYGMCIIRQIAKKLRYRRIENLNELSFRITLGAERHWEHDLAL